MRISVNTPSYRRPDAVKTLSYIPFTKVWVDEAEAEDYRKFNPQTTIISCPKGVQGNTARIRNYIIKEEFRAGYDAVLLLDDDISYIARFEVDKESGYGHIRHKLTTDEILPFLEKYSIMANDIGAKLWGINCNADSRSYEHFRPFSTLSFVGGPFQCFLRGNRCWYDESLPLKEDFDMTLQQLNKERVVFRVNAYHYVCDQSKSKGGCAAYRNREREAAQFDLLQKKWGDKIVKRDLGGKDNTDKERLFADYNPIIKIPIRGL